MTFRMMWLGGRGRVSNSHGAQWFPAPAVFDQLMGCLTLLGRPSLVTQDDNIQKELVFFFLSKNKKRPSHTKMLPAVSLF